MSDLPFDLIGCPDHGALGDCRVGKQHLFESARREAVAGDVDHIVRPCHDRKVTVGVDGARVACGVWRDRAVGRQMAVSSGSEPHEHTRKKMGRCTLGRCNVRAMAILGQRHDLVAALPMGCSAFYRRRIVN